MGQVMQKRVLCHANNKGADQPAHPRSLISTFFFVRCLDNDMLSCYIQSLRILASFCSWAGWFEYYLVRNLRRPIFAWVGSNILVCSFLEFPILCERIGKALVRLRRCTGWPEPSLFAYVINTIFVWGGSFIMLLVTDSPGFFLPFLLHATPGQRKYYLILHVVLSDWLQYRKSHGVP